MYQLSMSIFFRIYHTKKYLKSVNFRQSYLKNKKVDVFLGHSVEGFAVIRRKTENLLPRLELEGLKTSIVVKNLRRFDGSNLRRITNAERRRPAEVSSVVAAIANSDIVFIRS